MPPTVYPDKFIFLTKYSYFLKLFALSDDGPNRSNSDSETKFVESERVDFLFRGVVNICLGVCFYCAVCHFFPKQVNRKMFQITLSFVVNSLINSGLILQVRDRPGSFFKTQVNY